MFSFLLWTIYDVSGICLVCYLQYSFGFICEMICIQDRKCATFQVYIAVDVVILFHISMKQNLTLSVSYEIRLS